MNEAVRVYEEAVEGAAAYLVQRLPRDSWNSHRLGFVAAPILPSHPQGRLVIPYLTRAGVVEIKFRCIACTVGEKCDGHPKYLYASGGEQRLYNVNALFDPSPVIAVTEGEIDAITVQEATGIPCVGYPGASTWRPWFSRCFSGYERVLVVADGDEAGRSAAKGVCKEILKHAASAVVVQLPDGMDSNDYARAHGRDRLKELLRA